MTALRFLSHLMVLAILTSACAAGATQVTSEPTVADATPAAPPASAAPDAPVRVAPSATVVTDSDYELPPNLALITGAWPTDWSRRTVELDTLLPGIFADDPRDRIPPIDVPKFTRVPEVEWLADNEPGIVFSLGVDARFYPLSVLMRHEIVNDRVGGTPVAVTYCPLCNTAVVFDRRLGDEELRLGVSGLLRNSDLVMWDSDTTSLWQQITGEAIVGEFAGAQLTLLPSRIITFSAFAESFPEGLAMSADQGSGAFYGANPYVNYSSQVAPYSFFQSEPDPRLPALERVVGVDVAGEVRGYAFTELAEQRVINDELGGQPIVVWWGDPATTDALGGPSIPDNAAIGTGVAYFRTVDGQVLTFEALDDATFGDLETGSVWTITGVAISGPLEGATLDVTIHRNEFFFAWAAFFPEAELVGGA